MFYVLQRQISLQNSRLSSKNNFFALSSLNSSSNYRFSLWSQDNFETCNQFNSSKAFDSTSLSIEITSIPVGHGGTYCLNQPIRIVRPLAPTEIKKWRSLSQAFIPSPLILSPQSVHFCSPIPSPLTPATHAMKQQF